MYIVIKDGINYVRLKTEKMSFPYVYKIIEITTKDNDLFFILKKGSFINDSKIQKVECKYYYVKQNRIGAELEIFVYENDKGINDYTIYENRTFLCAYNTKANIIATDEFMAKYYLLYRDGKLQTNYEYLLLNGKLYNDEKLKNGDEIRFHNFVFFYYNDFLYINSFKTKIRLNRKEIEETFTKYETKKVVSKNYFNNNYQDLIIEDIKEYKPPHQTTSRKIIFQIGPSLTMSISMLAIASINIYNNYLNSQPLLNSIVYILMPLSMLFSGIVWPLLANLSDKRKYRKNKKKSEEQYISYLTKYELDLIEKIENYLRKENKEYFDGEIDENRLFYLTNRSPLFLNISIGHYVLKREVKAKDVDEINIQEMINRIKYRLNNIEDCPCFVDLKKYRTISIVSKKAYKVDLVKKFLLELSSKYHYDDFYLAIYSENLHTFADFYSLPQLIFNNHRLTINKKRELQELNNLKLDKLLIILGNDQIEYTFTNNQIHLIQFCNDVNSICKDSELLIEYAENGNGFIYEKDTIPFSYESYNIDYKYINKVLAPYQRVNFMKKEITFKDLYKDFNILNYYQNRQVGLRADFATIDKEILSFDLHEKKDGPHGLIGGCTGSGKSELIVSMLLSLCIRYRPDYLNIILLDYKGGGIEESLSYKGKRIPHIIASIDNLEKDVLDRLIVAIDFECKKRQKLFKQLSNRAMSSIMNIDDYLNYYEKYKFPPISHLLIVVDEFAEIKKNNPETIKELISFSRIGRSLGLHLILATQRPNGTIDDEIWSNSHFKIALKLFSDKDSNEIIKSKDAAYLYNPGEFYLAVDDSLIKANSIYSKKDINNLDNYEVMLLDNRLNVIEKKALKSNFQLSEASYIVDKVLQATNKLYINVDKLVFNKPASLSREELIKKYPNYSGIVLGEIDDYRNNKQDILTFCLDKNVLIYSTRNKEINGIINSLDSRTIVIGSIKYETKYISDSLTYNLVDDIKYMFNKLIGDNQNITIVIEDLFSFLSYDETFSSYLYQVLSRKGLSKINVIALCKQSNINFKLLNCFRNKYAIEISENQDLINIFSCGSHYKEKSFFYNDSLIPFIPCKEEEIKGEKSIYERYIDYIPSKIKLTCENDKLLIGYSITKRREIYIGIYDELLISSYSEEVILKYKKIYGAFTKIKVELYSKELTKKEFDRYLWIGEGLYNQRLFYADGSDELNENEGCYFKGNKKEKIRVVDE